jgi:sugar/nucleoside kinase (ribokinase family)
VAAARVTYVEGFLFDAEPARRAAEKAAALAHENGGQVALTLSDPFCAERFRSEFLALVDHGVDILFANEAELTHLYEAASPDEALGQAAARCEVVALTRGPAGCTVVVGGERHDVPAAPVARVVDTTGAGDLFAAGFLHGLTTGRDARTCAVLGTIAAAEVISHYGARPEASLAELVSPALG